MTAKLLKSIGRHSAPLAGGGAFILLSLLLVGAFHRPLISPLVDFQGTLAGWYFDAQGLALTVGRLDVPCASLQYEAFQIDGKCYGYFGLTPSFLRIALNGLCPTCFGRWSRLMMVLAGLLIFASLILITRRAMRDLPEGWRKDLWATGFALVMTIGGPLVFILSDPYGYHESIVWACAFSLLGFWSISRHADDGSGWSLRLSLLCVFLALHSRFTIGAGLAGASCLWLAAPMLRRLAPMTGKLFSPAATDLPARSSFLAIGLIVAMTATPIAVQFLKFGSAMAPAEKQPFYQKFPERLEKIKGGMFKGKNLSCDATLYFSPAMITFLRHYPWVGPAYRDYWFAGRPLPDRIASACGDSDIDAIDPMYGLPHGAPAPLLLCVLGIAAAFRSRMGVGRDWWPLLAGGAAGCAPLVLLSAVTYRYTLDFLPLFAVGASISWAALARVRGILGKAAALLAVGLLAGYGLLVNLSAAQFSGSPQPYIFKISSGIAHFLEGAEPR